MITSLNPSAMRDGRAPPEDLKAFQAHNEARVHAMTLRMMRPTS
jgi:hypothetical protein